MVFPRRVLALALASLAVGVVWLAAGPEGVEAVSVSPDRAIASFASDADYVDAFRASVPAQFVGEELVEDVSFQRGRLVASGPLERVYRGGAPGLVFHVSYVAERTSDDTAFVEMSTVVTYESALGRAYFALVRPVHRLLVPWYWRHVVRRAVTRRAS